MYILPNKHTHFPPPRFQRPFCLLSLPPPLQIQQHAFPTPIQHRASSLLALTSTSSNKLHQCPNSPRIRACPNKVSAGPQTTPQHSAAPQHRSTAARTQAAAATAAAQRERFGTTRLILPFLSLLTAATGSTTTSSFSYSTSCPSSERL